ncbi:MAG: hypothetical protein K8W52_31270 [Deltaproteobacteria bacterium]|nr:hypothetical protein [Deltaproteobacteria bacterium]
MRPIFAAVLLAAVVPACAYDGAGLEGTTANPLRHDLGHRAFLDLTADSQVAVSASTDHGPLDGVSPKVVGGRAVLRATDDGVVLVEDLDVALDDVVVPPGTIGTAPLHLTEVVLHLGTQIAAEGDWSEHSVIGAGAADLLLDWSLVLPDGTPYPLATQKLRDQMFTVVVDRTDSGAITAHVMTSATGELRTFADRVTLSDLQVEVVANRAVVVE